MKIMLLWLVLPLFIWHPTLVYSTTNSIQCSDEERESLLRIKHGFSDILPGLFPSWQSDCCQWDGVRCSNRTGHVIALRLDGLNLEGEISPSIGELKHLKLLNLSSNYISGEIPPQLGNLSKLTTLDLSSNSVLNVKSLQWISRLRLLRYLDLSNADLSKAMDWMAIVSNFRYLSVLRMDDCHLPTKIPSSHDYINSSATLHSISLSANNFSDSSILLWLFNLPGIATQLVYLDLSENAFQGSIPKEFGNFHSLSYLSLSDNEFQGSVILTITKLCRLEQLYLGGNKLLDDELTDVIQAIVSCENRFLLTLDLSRNRFQGAIPYIISLLSSLKELYLFENQLSGEIPKSIGQLSMLEKLDVSFNSLEGTLTHTHFSNLSRLGELYLVDNLRLVINIDANWIPPFQLDIISFRSCKLGPRFPKWLQTQTKFSYLDVSDADISDVIPVSFWNSFSSNLVYLNMSYNQFFGTLPNLPGKIFVFEVDLSSNLLEGAIPSGYANVATLCLNDNKFSDSSAMLCPNGTSNLALLDLSNNLFSGELPDCWMNFSDLKSLHLENNRFSGSIPESIGTLMYLKYLHLYNNSFSGPIPATFENCSSLIILNLGYNLFTGGIPSWIGNALQYIGALILRKNHFTGKIPITLCKLANLQILDLGINNISGVVPSCISNFTGMTGNTDIGFHFSPPRLLLVGHQGLTMEEETAIVSWKREEQRFKETVRLVKYMDLSYNKMIGYIPDGISDLDGLLSLDLSQNELSGRIPFEIGNMTNLELLDLSHNRLTGPIPLSLARVSTLGILDVSNNKLYGKIPVSTQLQSFNASAYMGNPGLCGVPLPKCPKDKLPSKEANVNVEDEHADFVFSFGVYISVALGLIVGFWGVCGTLVIKTSWRHAYFRLLQKIIDRVF